MNGYRVTFVGGSLDGYQKRFEKRPDGSIHHAVMARAVDTAVSAAGIGSYEVAVRNEVYKTYALPGGQGEELFVAVLDGESAVAQRKVPEAEDDICCANCGCNPATGQPYDAEPVAHGPHTGQG